MAGDSPEEAVDAYLDRLRATLSCITTATAFASPFIPGRARGVTLRAHGQSEAGKIRLSTHGGQGELIFRLAVSFTTERISRVEERGWFQVSNASYHYRLLDYHENEIVVYHWHPTGDSSVRTPHLHVSAAGSIVLQQRVGSALADRKAHLGRIHFPTQHIPLEYIVELLIREFSVDPLRADWETVLRTNRHEQRQGRDSLS